MNILNITNYMAAAMVVGTVGIVFIIWQLWPARKRMQHAPTKITRDWLPTGNINFVVPFDTKNHGAYLLEVEEDRLIELLGGGHSREIRFRLASLEEAVTVVRSYNSNAEGRIRPDAATPG